MCCSEWFLNVIMLELLEYNNDEVWPALQLQWLALGSYFSKIGLCRRAKSFSFKFSQAMTALSHPGGPELTLSVIVSELVVLGSGVQHPDFLVVRQRGSKCAICPGWLVFPRVKDCLRPNAGLIMHFADLPQTSPVAQGALCCPSLGSRDMLQYNGNL